MIDIANQQLNDSIQLITNLLGNYMDGVEDKMSIDLSKKEAELFDANKTSILQMLIKMEDEYTPEEINQVLDYFSEFICLMGMSLVKAKALYNE